MTASQIITCAVSWTAAAVACLALIRVRRAARDLQAQQRTFPWNGGEVTVTAPMSQADYEDLKARWLQRYGQPSAACGAYQPPATAEMTGLCARCGMYDYKHQEQPDA